MVPIEIRNPSECMSTIIGSSFTAKKDNPVTRIKDYSQKALFSPSKHIFNHLPTRTSISILGGTLKKPRLQAQVNLSSGEDLMNPEEDLTKPPN